MRLRENTFEPNFDAPLKVKPDRLPDPENTANLIATMSARIQELELDLAKKRPKTDPSDKAIALRHISEIVAEKREPQWLLHKILEANVLAVLAGARASLKSIVALHWAMLIAKANHPVVFLSGEGSGLDRRVDAWMAKHGKGIDLDEIPVYALERAINLSFPVELGELMLAIDALPSRPDLIVVDTFSKFSAGIDENSNSDVSAYLAGLSRGLREEFRASILLVAHSGHGESKRPRGASALMANPDAEYIVDRPDIQKLEISVSRDRFKDSPSFEPLGYCAEVIDLQRLDSYNEPVTSLVLVDIDAPAKIVNTIPRGANQRALLAHFRAVKNDGAGIWTMTDMRDMARKLGQNKGSARTAVEGLVTSGFMTPTIGGYRISDDAQ